jgi:uncharacterized phage protein gp47/JayE
MSYGITSAGFVRKPRSVIQSEVEADLRVQFGADVDLTPQSPHGALATVFVDQLDERWQSQENNYYAFFPDTSEDTSLERVVSYGGLSRKQASKAIVELEIFGVAGTVVSNGFQGQTATGKAFETTESVTIAAIEGYQEISSIPVTFSGSTIPLIAANTYDLDVTIDGGGLNQLTFALAPTHSWDDVVALIETALQTATGSTETVIILGGSIRITSATTGDSSVVLIAAGTAGSGGGDFLAAVDLQIANMTTTIETAVDGSTGRADADAQAIDSGVDGNVGAATITTIGTPVAGVTSVNNREAATEGDAIETDAALRARFQAGGLLGGSSAESIQTQLNALDSIITAKVFENNTDAVDGDGLPPHSIEAVVDGGTDAEIGDILLRFKAAGIETFGGNTTTVVDNAGISRTFKFSRPTNVSIWVDVDIVSNSEWDSTYAVTVKARVAEIVGGTSGGVTYSGNGISADVLAWQIIANMDDILGIEEMSVDVDTSGPPSGLTVAISRSQRAITDDAKITVAVT